MRLLHSWNQLPIIIFIENLRGRLPNCVWIEVRDIINSLHGWKLLPIIIVIDNLRGRPLRSQSGPLLLTDPGHSSPIDHHPEHQDHRKSSQSPGSEALSPEPAHRDSVYGLANKRNRLNSVAMKQSIKLVIASIEAFMTCLCLYSL